MLVGPVSVCRARFGSQRVAVLRVRNARVSQQLVRCAATTCTHCLFGPLVTSSLDQIAHSLDPEIWCIGRRHGEGDAVTVLPVAFHFCWADLDIAVMKAEIDPCAGCQACALTQGLRNH